MLKAGYFGGRYLQNVFLVLHTHSVSTDSSSTDFDTAR